MEEKTGKNSYYWVLHLKHIAKVATYEQVRVSEMDKNIPRVVLYWTANSTMRRVWGLIENFIKIKLRTICTLFYRLVPSLGSCPLSEVDRGTTLGLNRGPLYNQKLIFYSVEWVNRYVLQ